MGPDNKSHTQLHIVLHGVAQFAIVVDISVRFEMLGVPRKHRDRLDSRSLEEVWGYLSCGFMIEREISEDIGVYLAIHRSQVLANKRLDLALLRFEKEREEHRHRLIVNPLRLSHAHQEISLLTRETKTRTKLTE
jgi:hypothetical protein